jgi:hypothetical protein
MWEFGICNIVTGEQSIIWGYDLTDAFRRSKTNPDEWEVTYQDYVD